MSDDNELKQAIHDELKWEPSVNAAHIGVTTNAGVTLKGHVESYAEKSAAERAARRVKDVKAVAEEIEVRLPFVIGHRPTPRNIIRKHAVCNQPARPVTHFPLEN
jgi:hypothetical protein